MWARKFDFGLVLLAHLQVRHLVTSISVRILK